MPYTVVQTGTDLNFVAGDGTLVPVTLPTGITLRDDVPPRWLVSGRYLILVNTPNYPITIDATGTARPLAPRPPAIGTVLSGQSGGTLSGTYVARYTFVITDGAGNLIAESDFSPLSNSATITSQDLRAASLELSSESSVTGRRIYRSTTDGSVLFQWIDLDGNILTSVQDDLPDAALSLFPAPILGSPPYLTHISEFRGRLFGVNDISPDNLLYTEAGLRYSWPSDNIIPIQPVGSDNTGITALALRRDALGVGKLNSLWQIVGSGEETNGIPDLEPIRISEQCGILSQESVAVYRDTAYFLWYDGVYQWDSSGITCISDGMQGKGNIRTWFTTDNEFDRSTFPQAFGIVDPVNLKYRLFLDNPDGEKRWIEYDLRDKTWWGPHKTTAFTPKSTFYVSDPSETSAIIPVMGAEEGYFYGESDDYIDGENESIAFSAEGKAHGLEEPDYDKYFGELSISQKAQPEGTLQVITTVGELDPDDGTVVSTLEADLTVSRDRADRVGVGKHAQLTFENNELDVGVELYGYEINPVNIIGRR